jgi:hypothetical protein
MFHTTVVAERATTILAPPQLGIKSFDLYEDALSGALLSGLNRGFFLSDGH